MGMFVKRSHGSTNERLVIAGMASNHSRHAAAMPVLVHTHGRGRNSVAQVSGGPGFRSQGMDRLHEVAAPRNGVLSFAVGAFLGAFKLFKIF